MLIGIGLLKVILETKDSKAFLKLNPEWFIESTELQYLNLIKDYFNKYTKLPPKSFLPKDDFEDHPLEFWYDSIKTRYKLFLLDSIKQTIDTNGIADKNIDDIQNTLNKITISANEEILTGDILKETMVKEIQKVRERHLISGLAGLDTGWATLNNVLGGYAEGDIVVFSARAKIGKTTVLLYSANHILKQNKKVLFISMEMTSEQIMRRLLTLSNNLNSDIFRDVISSFVEDKIMVSIDKIKDNFFLVEGNLKMGFNYLNSLLAVIKPDVVFIDGAYLLRTNKIKQALWEEITDVIINLKKIAMLYNVPIICSYQLNRVGSRRDNLGLEHLALSDAIGQVASCVVGIIETEIPMQRKMEVIAVRDGRSQDFFINWDWSNMNFNEIGGDNEYQHGIRQENFSNSEDIL